jgi:hypothetical protein
VIQISEKETMTCDDEMKQKARGRRKYDKQRVTRISYHPSRGLIGRFHVPSVLELALAWVESLGNGST